MRKRFLNDKVIFFKRQHKKVTQNNQGTLNCLIYEIKYKKKQEKLARHMLHHEELYSIKDIARKVNSSQGTITCSGVSGAEAAYLCARLLETGQDGAIGKKIVFVLEDEKRADTFMDDLAYFSPHEEPMYYPMLDTFSDRFLSHRDEAETARITTLYSLSAGECHGPVVVTAGALLQKTIPKKTLSQFAELLVTSEDVDRELLIQKLAAAGYERTLIVEEPGSYCVRGGILDIFSPQYPDPIRIEQYGDTIDSMRFFSAATQRKLGDIFEAVIIPARENILSADGLESNNTNSLDRVLHRIRERAANQGLPVTKTRAIVDAVKAGEKPGGMTDLVYFYYDTPGSFFDYIPGDWLFVIIEQPSFEKVFDLALEKGIEAFKKDEQATRLCAGPDKTSLGKDQALSLLESKRILNVGLINTASPPDSNGDGGDTEVRFSVNSNTDLSAAVLAGRGKERMLAPLADWAKSKHEQGHDVVFVCGTKAMAERLESLLRPYGIYPRPCQGFPEMPKSTGTVFISLGKVSGGFDWPGESISVIIEDEIFGKKQRRKKQSRKADLSKLMGLDEIDGGDIVVHAEHGLGRYFGLVKLTLEGTTNDFLLIIYRDDDRLYLPVDRMGQISKYIGIDGVDPALDKMGGKAWNKVKSKIKKSAELIAGELLKLYAERKVRKGHAFSRVDASFKDFEAAFPFEETEDQLRAIEDVLADMESEIPMDRLVCGDVGYGKTEVALRAAYMAVQDGKQSAILVPTTVLSEQHLDTFSVRFKDYPINIAGLSRFRSAAEQKRIIKDLAEGKIDIVIGTHRLLSKDVAFKDLGLLIVDEEQRFGVKHKEKLKGLKSSVDALALTATPIPRTLHMSLTSVRDISVIATPPEARQAIKTYICEFDESIIASAIQKELDRGGQIFFVHNRIHNIDEIALRIQKLVPGLRVGIAHGRLDERALEKVMVKFVNRQIDMLVCTSIIESGLDIPAANTILVNRVDMFGLAQLYQLRGRVGRAGEQAYAYLIVNNEEALSRDAQKRLKVLMEHTDLGAGFQIAMSDLKIRGGGSMLGASQSGHVAAVGYDMFLKLLEEAVSDIKGEEFKEELDPEVNVSLSCFVPEDYVPEIDQRLSIYRRLSKFSELWEIQDFKQELKDRFGPPPEEARNLLFKILLKVFAKNLGIKRVDIPEGMLVLHFSSTHMEHAKEITEFISENPERLKTTPDGAVKVKLSGQTVHSQLLQAKNILKEIIQRVKQ